jgi:hypothetical protein
MHPPRVILDAAPRIDLGHHPAHIADVGRAHHREFGVALTAVTAVFAITWWSQWGAYWAYRLAPIHTIPSSG